MVGRAASRGSLDMTDRPSGRDPRLRTSGLVLRPMPPAVAHAVVSGRRTPDWAAGFPQEGDLTIAELLVAGGADSTTPWGPWEVRTVAGTLIGTAGFHGPPSDGDVEIGYGIEPGHRGRGYAGQAVAALIAFARDAGVDRVLAAAEPGNTPSIRVLERAGFARVPDAATGAGAEGAPRPPTESSTYRRFALRLR